MIKNPIAACLAYDLEEDNSKESLILVYQMGGNSIEVSLVNLLNGLYRIIDSIVIKNLGGDLFTDLIIDILCEEFQR
jgi:molecular chaperone DnaK (HSP70)